MIASLVRAVINNPISSFVIALGIIVAGVYSLQTLPIDAVPDVSNVQVQVLASAPGLSPLEVESQVTQVIERELAGIPHLARQRSVSRAGISVVTLVFESGTEIMLARELVSQRLPGIRGNLGDELESLQVGPLTTGLGEIYHFTVSWPGHSLAELRTVVDWELAPPLARVPGVVEVNSWGGDRRQIVVVPRRERLVALGSTETELRDALAKVGRNISGGMFATGAEGTFLRLDGVFRSLEDVRQQVVAVREHGGARQLIRVGDVAEVKDGVGPRLSGATAGGKGEILYTMVQMLAGENAHEVVGRVKARLAEITPTLPSGVTVEPFYDRSAFVDDVLGTVKRNLVEGGAIVSAVLLFMLGSLKAGLVVASVIPLSMLGAFALMRLFGVSGNLLSLGAIDFGLVVDGAVVVVEGTLAAMAAHGINGRAAVGRVGTEVGRPVTVAVLIIGIVYLPVLLLEGVEGRLFRPMALTVLFALLTAFVLTFTWVPTLAALTLSKAPHGEPRAVRWLRRRYESMLRPLLTRPYAAAIASVALTLAGGATLYTLGGEFLPRLEEGGLAIQVTRPPSISLAEAVRGTTVVEQVVSELPEVERVVSRIGSPDVATDVMGVEQADVLVSLAPRTTWRSASDAAGFADVLSERLRAALPGSGFSFTQPIEMRVSELIGGVQSDVGVKVFGDDLDVLRSLADAVASTLNAVPGAADVRVEPTRGLEVVGLKANSGALALQGVGPEQLGLHLRALRAGAPLGTFHDGLRRFPLVMRYDGELQSLQQDALVSDQGTLLPLNLLTERTSVEGPAQVSREQARRRVLVEANVRGRDLAGFVGDAQARLAHLSLPPGYSLEFGGQYENLVRAGERLLIVVPLTLLLVLGLLYLAFGRVRPALLVFLNVPAAAAGGAFALASRGLDLSLSAAVGFLALFGVATLNGVVLMNAALTNDAAGRAPYDSAFLAASERLRPVVTTALVAALGFLPMALASGTGAEVQRPLATVVIGGLITSTLATLLALPPLMNRFAFRRRTESSQ